MVQEASKAPKMLPETPQNDAKCPPEAPNEPLEPPGRAPRHSKSRPRSVPGTPRSTTSEKCRLFAPSRVQNESQKRRKKREKRCKNARACLRSVFIDLSCQKSSKIETDFDGNFDENLKRRFLENCCFNKEKQRFSRFGLLKNDRKPKAKSIKKHTRFLELISCDFKPEKRRKIDPKSTPKRFQNES